MSSGKMNGVGGRRTIVVLAQQGMGDIIMMGPLLRNCDANLTGEDSLLVLVQSQVEAQVVRAVSLAIKPEIWIVERGGVGNFLKLVKTAFALRSRKPWLLIAPLLFDRFRNAIWTRLVGAQVSAGPFGRWTRYGLTRTVEKEVGMHQVEFFVRCGVVAGLPDVAAPDIRLPVSPEQQLQARSRMMGWGPEQRWIAFGPGSGVAEAFKRWPPAHYQQLVKLLVRYSPDVRVAFFGSVTEKPLLASIVDGLGEEKQRCVIFASNDFGTSLALLTQCHCMVAACAGLLHMAAAAGIPVVGLYGPSNPGNEGAYSKRHYAVHLRLPCSPCYRLGFTRGCGEPICMSAIEPQMVFRAVIDALNKVDPAPVPWLAVTRATRPSRAVADAGHPQDKGPANREPVGSEVPWAKSDAAVK